MKIIIESTAVVVGIGATAARRWEGVTDTGIPIVAFVAAISPQTHDDAVNAQFAGELQQTVAPETRHEAATVEGVDHARVAPLAVAIMRVTLPELARQPFGRSNVFVTLNALASAVATVIVGTDAAKEAWQFFEQAVTDNIVAVRNRKAFDEGGTFHMDREGHLAWAKARALEYVDRGELKQAFASMTSDLLKHEAFLDEVYYRRIRSGLRAAMLGDAETVRRWIEEFN